MSTKPSKKIIILCASLVLVVGLGIGGFAIYKNATKSKAVLVSSLLEKNPAKVGTFRYVNPCQAFPASDYKAVFGYDKSNYTFDSDVHAEGSNTKRAVISSQCVTSFDHTPPVNGDQLTDGDRGYLNLTLDQYPQDEKSVQQLFDANYKNSQYDAMSVGGVDVAVRSFDNMARFYFSHRNVIITVDSSPSTYYPGKTPLVFTKAYATNIVNKIVPIITAAIDNPNLSQAPERSPDTGQKLADGKGATVINACDYFTTQDFQAIINGSEDTTSVGAETPLGDAVESAASVKQLDGGRGNSSCYRYGLISTPEPSTDNQADSKAYLTALESYNKIVAPEMKVNYLYYNSAQEASKTIDLKLSSAKQLYPDLKVKELKGVGDRAVTLDYTYTSDVTNTKDTSDARNKYYTMYLAKGPYILEMNLVYRPGRLALDQSTIHMASEAQYIKAAQLLGDRLPK